ncbi:MAG TPA: hypothetical protein VLC10_03560 [Patescibacteria group bacterium]|nr:hypothetical protein [Patescibacteria group bacterium]
MTSKDDVRIYWGLTVNVRNPEQGAKYYIVIGRAQKDGKTDVEFVLEPRIP